MTRKQFLTLSVSAITICMLSACGRSPVHEAHSPLVRLAELEIDPAQLQAYTAVLKEEIETSIRIEPGVLTLYAVALKESPDHIRLFETYADQAAYKSHLETPHFKKYKTATQGMVKSLKLLETDPIVLGARSK